MSCSQSEQTFSKNAAADGGIRQAANKSANLAGSGTKRAAAWVNENPGKAAMTGGSLYAVGLTALYNYKRRRVRETTGSLAVTGIKTSIRRTGPEPGQAEFDLAAQVDQGLYLVEQRIGRPDISRVTLADTFGFSDAMADMAQYELSKGNRKQRRVAKAYKAMRPVIVGQYFLGARIKQLPLGAVIESLSRG